MATEKRLIDANALIDEWNTLIKKMRKDSDGAYPVDFAIVISAVSKANTVDAVEVVHGRWRTKVLEGGFAEEWGYVCSECGCTVSDRSNLSFGRFASINQRLNYCPNCGADMRGDGNDI